MPKRRRGITIAIPAIIMLALLISSVHTPVCKAESRDVVLDSDSDRERASMEILKEADKLFSAREYDKAGIEFEKARESAAKSGQNSELTEALSMIARCYLIQDKKDDGRKWIIEAEKIASSAEPLGWSRFLGVKGRFQWQDKELEAATKTFREMYEFCSAEKLHDRAIDAAHMVAITGTPEEQVEWALKGIEAAEDGNVTGWLGPLWNNLGWTYEDRKEYEKSLEAYLKAREYHWLYGTERNKLIADWAVGHAHLKAGNREEAGKWLRPVLAWCERIEEVEFRGLTCQELGEIELADENYEAALGYFVRAEVDLKEAGMPEWDADTYKKLVGKIADIRKRLGE